MKKLVLSVLASTLVMWGCTQDTGTDNGAEDPPPEDTSLTVTMVAASDTDTTLGTVTLSDEEGGGVLADFDIGANDVIAGGDHAIHIHENGSCAAADTDDDGEEEPAGAAGGHYDPTDVGHGEDNGPHGGDSEAYNYTFADDGSFTGDVLFPLLSMDGENPVLDEGGTALMIHEGVDDTVTDPGGDAGTRIACGAIATGAI